MLLVVLGALVGFGIGRRAAEGAVTSAKGDLLRSDRERFTAETLHRRLLADNEALERAMSEPIAVVETAPEPEPGPVLESIRAIMRLQDAKVTVRVTAVLAGKISAEFAALYGLTDADVARLNDAIRQAHAEFKEPVVTAANVSMVNGAVVVMVPASDDGAKLRQKGVERRDGRARGRHIDANGGQPTVSVAKIILHIDHDHRRARQINRDRLGLRHHGHRHGAAQGPHQISMICADPPGRWLRRAKGAQIR